MIATRLTPLALALAGLCLSPAAEGRVWNVTNGGTSPPLTIQAGIDSASNGDVVLVGPGRYLENIEFKGKDIELRSQAGPAVTTVDGSSHHLPCVRFVTRESHAATITGFTLTGGLGMPPDSPISAPGGAGSGGGVLIFESEPTIQGNLIESNQALYYLPGGTAAGEGGGIACRSYTYGRDFSPVIINNTIRNNKCGVEGGGIYARGAFSPVIIGNVIQANEVVEGNGGGILVCAQPNGARIIDNTILDNHASFAGGVLLCSEIPGSSGSAIVSGNLIARNHARTSGGLCLYSVSAWIHNNTIVKNDDGPGITTAETCSPLIERNIIALHNDESVSCGYGGASPVIRDNMVWQNRDPYYPCLVAGSNGNVMADPFFCNIEAGDYSVAANSPALVNDQGIIMGAFQFSGCTARTPVIPTTWGDLKSLRLR